MTSQVKNAIRIRVVILAHKLHPGLKKKITPFSLTLSNKDPNCSHDSRDIILSIITENKNLPGGNGGREEVKLHLIIIWQLTNEAGKNAEANTSWLTMSNRLPIL